MIIAIYTEQGSSFEQVGITSLLNFLMSNEHIDADEISVIHSHLNSVGEYIGGGGSSPYFKLERIIGEYELISAVERKRANVPTIHW